DQLQFFQTGVTLNDVVLDRNTELLRDLNNRSRHLDVSTRWCWVSSRMIVHQHDRTARCPLRGPPRKRFLQHSYRRPQLLFRSRIAEEKACTRPASKATVMRFIL